jgi:hypothetical protein
MDERLLAWRCDVCEGPVHDRDGYVCVDYADLREYERQARAWDEAHVDAFFVPVSEYDTYPTLVRWHVLHGRCDPRPDSADYWIGVERIRTPDQVIAWSAHLLGKRWIQTTTWPDVLRSVASQLGGSL